MFGEPEVDLPDWVNITADELALYWEPWLYWHITEGKQLPSQIISEPERPIAVFLELERLHGIVDRQMKAQENHDR